MPKGNSNRLRSNGNGRTGLRDTPVVLRRILQACIADPRLLDGLPPNDRELRQAQIQAFQATRGMRSGAAKAGWAVRRAREIDRLLDRLTDPDDPREASEIWETFTPRQQELVGAEIDRQIEAEKAAKAKAAK